jgi:hypothetical protein
MPTNPTKDLYEPDTAVAAIEPLARDACPVLREIISQGAAILARCSVEAEHRSDGGPLDEHLAVFIQYHHLLEMLDTVNEALRLGRAVGARPPLRSAFEALLGIEFILDGRFEERAFAFLVGKVMEKLEWCDRLTPSTPARKELDAALAEDRWHRTHVLPEVENIDAIRDRLMSALEKPKWKEAANAWRVAETKNKYVRWHGLYDGPTSIKKLARAVGRPYQYELLYGPLSQTVHVGDAGRIFGNSGGVVGFTCIPDWRQADTMMSLAFGIGVWANFRVLHHYRDEREWFWKWYAEEVRAMYLRLTGEEFTGL